MQKPRIKSFLQGIMAVLLLAAFLVTPVEFAMKKATIPMQEHSVWLLEQASVTLEYQPEQITDGLNRSYIQLLHSILYVFGNSMTVARQFQNVLWLLVLLCVYLLLRRLFVGGWLATAALFVGVAAAWLFPEEIYQLRAVVLLVLATAVVLWLLVWTVTALARRRSAEKSDQPKTEELPMVEETELEEEETVPAVEQAEVRQIPNVLPEPKRHVKREAVDFARQIPAERMYFELADDPEDDFDLK